MKKMSTSSEENPGKNRKVMFVVTQEGCPPCPDYAKMASEAAPKDVSVKEIKLGKSEDIDSLVAGLGVQMTPTALYVENGEIKRLITPSGRAEGDRAAIVNVQKIERETREEGVQGCPAWLRMGPEGWRLEVKGGQECEDVVTAAQSLGPGGRKSLKRHLTSEDHAVQELLGKLSES